MIKLKPILILLGLGILLCLGVAAAFYGYRKEKSAQQAAIRKASAGRLLQQTVSYYRQRGDSLGIESARFLVGNLPGHGTYDAGSKELVPDETQITSSYLISMINSSLVRCRPLIQSGKLSKSDFFEYVLPYRLGEEGVSDWKNECITQYEQLDDSLGNNPDGRKEALDRIVGINAQLIGNFKFTYDGPNARNLSWKELITSRTGNCVAMAHTITYPLRALGIPVGVDFATSWGNLNGDGHTWNAYVSGSGRPVAFLGFESSPPEYNPFGIYRTLGRLPAKVFRYTYSVNARALPSIVATESQIPVSLDFNRAVDVTAQYFSTDDIKIKLPAEVVRNLEGEMLYLSCFNKGEWKPVFWSELAGKQYYFRDMVSKMLYLPSVFDRSSGATAVDYPFVVENGVVHRFRPDMGNRQNIRITFTQPKEMDALALFGKNLPKQEFEGKMNGLIKDQGRTRPEPGSEYELYYWHEGWQFAGQQTAAKDHALVFRNVPGNAIYRLISEKNPATTARVFSYPGKQQWW